VFLRALEVTLVYNFMMFMIRERVVVHKCAVYYRRVRHSKW
jgi:hypothetical protein